MKALTSYRVSATLIVIENRNNGLWNRKLDFTLPAMYCRAAMYRERRKQYDRTLPKSAFQTKTCNQHEQKGRLLMFCNQTVCGEMAIFITTSSNLRVPCACDVLLMDGTFKSCPRYSYTLSDMRLIRVFHNLYLPVWKYTGSNENKLFSLLPVYFHTGK